MLGGCSALGCGMEGWEEWGGLEGPGHPPLWWFVGIPLGVLRPQSKHSVFCGAGDPANLLRCQEGEAAFAGSGAWNQAVLGCWATRDGPDLPRPPFKGLKESRGFLGSPT